MAASRQALVTWVNELLQLEISKLDQLGSGAVYCQIMDSIYEDVPMSKVKFDARAEYEYQHNFKILQIVFNKHNIDRTFDTQRLIKCRLQDNLDFIQWMHKFWVDNFPGGEYDPVARRNGRGITNVSSGNTRTSLAPSRTASTSSSGSRASGRVSTAPARTTSRTSTRTSTAALPSNTSNGTRVASRTSIQPAASATKVAELEAQIEELEHTVGIVTTERTLYYSKLLEIEELVQTKLNALYADQGEDAGMNSDDPTVEVVRSIQAILYATAEGFETPYRPEDEPF